MSENKSVKKYSKDGVTVVWQPDLCIHSAICAKGLPEVFDPKKRPWVNMEGSELDKIIDQVKQCPSGALSVVVSEEGAEENATVEEETIVETIPNGPLMVYGNLVVKHADGTEKRDSKVTAFCRCGASQNKPFCDGAHKKVGFEG